MNVNEKLLATLLSNAKGTPSEAAAAKVAAYYRSLCESQPAGPRARRLQARDLANCDQAIRQFCYGGVPLVGACQTFGIDVARLPEVA